jgi:uncharacterized RDD family membrane protein YckC
MFSPMSLLFVWQPLNTWKMMALLSVLSISLYIAYEVVFHFMWGQTIGKVVVGVRVQLTSGQPLTKRATLLRFGPEILIELAILAASIYAYSHMPYDFFISASIEDKANTLRAAWPPWFSSVDHLSTVWYLVGAVTLLANRRKRALHDYLAGTVVVKVQPFQLARNYRAV